ncbi:MAG: alkaline phosphatase family protein [Acidisphaera sp.]|nr:alkaline phosphatase family protein [Acidisphaera sp.]
MKQRNVLLIVVDQWRADCLPALGTKVLRTPNLDRLCREGVTFRNHVTTAVPCGPARASLHTGLYLMNHRQVQNWVPLDARHVTLPRLARACGYDPALIGYTTTTPDPRTTPARDPRFTVVGDMMEGWRTVGAFGPHLDFYFGWLAQHGFPLPKRREDIWLPEGAGDVRREVRGATDRPARVPAELSDSAFFTEKALTYLKGRDGKPFFLHLGYYRPHPPFVASAPYHAMYAPADMPAPRRAATAAAEAAQHPLLAHYLRATRQASFFEGGEGMAADMDEATVRQMRATYFGMMTEVDDGLGRVFAYLDAAGLWDDTLVVFTSDHGEQLGDHHLLGKIGYHSESFRIPLVIRDPDAHATRGRIEDAWTEMVDILPTLMAWVGGDVPHAVDGRSLLPLLHGARPPDWRDALHYEFDFRDTPGASAESDLGLDMDACSLCVLHDADYKYVHFAALPPLLFDMRADPHEFRNLADDPAHADTVRSYAQRMLSWRMRHADRTLTQYVGTPGGLRDRQSGAQALSSQERASSGSAGPTRDKTSAW